MRDDLLDDYRLHLALPDPDHQILQLKARRDRFDHRHGHRPYLCSPRSEDILTWTVFRTLERLNAMGPIAAWLGVDDPCEILYWLLHAERHSSAQQLALSNLLLEVDGQLGGQMTEPDIVLVGRSAVCFVEAKLGEPDRKPTLWSSADAKRFPLYEEYLRQHGVDLFARELADGEQQEFYQLIRNVFYAWALGHRLKLKPQVVCLVNERNWNAPTRSIREAFQDFSELICGDPDAPFPRSNLVLRTWQGLRDQLRSGDAGTRELSVFLEKHPYL